MQPALCALLIRSHVDAAPRAPRRRLKEGIGPGQHSPLKEHQLQWIDVPGGDEQSSIPVSPLIYRSNLPSCNYTMSAAANGRPIHPEWEAIISLPVERVVRSGTVTHSAAVVAHAGARDATQEALGRGHLAWVGLLVQQHFERFLAGAQLGRQAAGASRRKRLKQAQKLAHYVIKLLPLPPPSCEIGNVAIWRCFLAEILPASSAGSLLSAYIRGRVTAQRKVI